MTVGQLGGSAAKAAEAAKLPKSPFLSLYHGEGDGVTVYVGHRYFTAALRGFSGWSSSRWMPGGWEFYGPYVGTGRTDRNASRYAYGKLLVPAGIVHLWRKRAYRVGMREEPIRND